MIQDDYQWIRDNLTFIKDINWKAVFDFDCNEHILKFLESEGMVVKKTTSDDFASEFNLCRDDQLQRVVDEMNRKQPSWIFVNGRGAEEPYSPTDWKIERARGFKKTVQFFSDMFPDCRDNVVFLLLSADIGVLLKAADDFLTVFSNQWMCVVEEEDTGNMWIDKLQDEGLIKSDERVVVGMQWSHVNAAVMELRTQKNRRASEIRVPTSTGGTIVLPPRKVNQLPDIEILGIDEYEEECRKMDEQQREQLRKEEEMKFYGGQPPSWYNFCWFQTQVCARDIRNDLQPIVENALKSSSDHDFVDRVHIYHEPGAGGTTLAKDILWTLRKKYRVGIVEKCNSSLGSEQIDKLVSQIMAFHMHEENERAKAKPVLLLLDNPEEETETSLLNELKVRAIKSVRFGDKSPVVCVFLECLHITQMSRSTKKERNRVFLKHELSPGEIAWFKEKGAALQDDYKKNRSYSADPDTLISFNILKENFNPDFIRNTVEKLVMAVTNEKERTLLKYVSLLNAFDIRYSGVPLAALDEMMGEWQTVGKKNKVMRHHWEDDLSDEFHVLVYQSSESSTDYTRALYSKNSLLAKETLDALLRLSNGKETVSDTALSFLKCDVFNVRRKPQEMLMNIVKDVLKKREGGEQHSGEFSPLILEILKNESGGKAQDVLKKGYELTDDPFVAQQLARLCIKRGNWDQALDVIKSAVDRPNLPDNSYLLDTYGRIYEKQLSSEYDAEYKEGLKSLAKDRMTEVVELGLKGIEQFQKGQSASEKEKTKTPNKISNNASYHGELKIVCTLMDYLMCCDAFQDVTEADLREFLLNETLTEKGHIIMAGFHLLAEVRERDYMQRRDYIQIFKSLKPRVDTVLKRLDDEKLQLKVTKKHLRPPPDLSVDMMVQLRRYFGENPDELPPNLPENDQCSFRRRQIFRLAGNNINGIFKLRRKNAGEQALTKVRHIIEKNIRSDAVSAIDYLIAMSTNLALTSINPEWCEEIEFETMSKWSIKLYEKRQMLSIHSEMRQIYLEPYLFMTMFNWPRGNTSQNVMPKEVDSAISQWKDAFLRKYPDRSNEAKSHHKKETTQFFLAKGIGMESVYTTSRAKAALSSDFWQQPEIQTKLQRFEGELKYNGMSLNYHFSGATLNIPTSFLISDRTWWNQIVHFVIGFSWAGPKAFDVQLK